jgi:hypothetical protein
MDGLGATQGLVGFGLDRSHWLQARKRGVSKRFAIAMAAALLAALAQVVPGDAAVDGLHSTTAAAGEAYPCNIPYGQVLIHGSDWAGGLTALLPKADGANLDVMSNYKNGSCVRGIEKGDGNNLWSTEYQCTELAIRVADVVSNDGGSHTWTNAQWNGDAYNMWDVAQDLSVPLQKFANGSTTTMPQLGDLLIFDSTSSDSTGHVAVVESASGGTLTFVGENESYGQDTIPYSVSGSGVVTANGSRFIGGTPQHNAVDEVRGWLRGTVLSSAEAPSPAVAVTPSGQQIVFWRGANGNIHEAWYNSSWSDPVDLGSAWAATSGPAVAVTSSGEEIVFWTGTNGDIHEAWYTTAWNGPVDLGSAWAATSSPAVAVTPSGQEIVFWRGANGNIHEAWYNSSWNGPVDLGSAWAATSGPAVAVTSSGEEIVFWTGTDGDVHEAWYTTAWNGPADYGEAWAATSGPAVAVMPNGQQLVFWQGTNGNIHEAWYNSSWSGPVDLGSNWAATSGPAAAVTPHGTQELVFFRGTDGDAHEFWYTTSWNGPADYGSQWAMS